MILYTEYSAAQTLVSNNLMAPFSEEQKVRIVTLWGELKSFAKVWCKLAQEYGYAHHPRDVMGDKASYQYMMEPELEGRVPMWRWCGGAQWDLLARLQNI